VIKFSVASPEESHPVPIPNTEVVLSNLDPVPPDQIQIRSA
jgi:hypothetical protein